MRKKRFVMRRNTYQACSESSNAAHCESGTPKPDEEEEDDDEDDEDEEEVMSPPRSHDRFLDLDDTSAAVATSSADRTRCPLILFLWASFSAVACCMGLVLLSIRSSGSSNLVSCVVAARFPLMDSIRDLVLLFFPCSL